MIHYTDVDTYLNKYAMIEKYIYDLIYKLVDYFSNIDKEPMNNFDFDYECEDVNEIYIDKIYTNKKSNIDDKNIIVKYNDGYGMIDIPMRLYYNFDVEIINEFYEVE